MTPMRSSSANLFRMPALLAVVVLLHVLGGCATEPLSGRMLRAADSGSYGTVRVALEQRLTDDRSDRNFVLDRARLLVLTLADGSPDQAEEVANETFDLLRLQGLNADRTTASVVLHEGVRIWKGEPFEQALSFHYIALQKAMRGEWDNARAAAQSSLFLLRDFGDNEKGERLSSVEIARRAALEERRKASEGDYFDHGYAAVKTDFAPGYLMNALAARALGREDEASDHFREAATIDPRLEGLVHELRRCNTVFVVDYGRGPRKAAYGPDNAFSRFEPMRRSDGRGLLLRQAGAGNAAWPAVSDVNQMATSHRWNNLEDVRSAKSTIGSALLIGGTSVAMMSDNRDAQWIGLGVALAGAIMKASAVADTRHLEFTPQRIYFVPATITERGTTVELEVEGDSTSRMTLAGLNPPRAGGLQLRYVRMPSLGGQAWAVAGRPLYRSASYDEPVEGDDMPFILGGRDVSLPTAVAMDRYHRAGNLTDMTSVELENLYRAEGIALSVEDQRGRGRAHVLEGGDSLVAPLAGTAGFARLFGQLHPPYRPRSQELKDVATRVAAQKMETNPNPPTR